MIVLKTSRELAIMREACRISAKALKLAGEAVEPGVSTWEIDRVVRRAIEEEGGKPNFLGYGGFPGSACVSVNDVVIHGIPHKEIILKEGDIVSIDTGAFYEGFNGDNAYTFPCGDVSEEAKRLMDVTRESLFEGIKAAQAGARIGDIGSAVQRYVEARGYSVVRDFVGHGVGAKLHEDPSVPNYGTPKQRRLCVGRRPCHLLGERQHRGFRFAEGYASRSSPVQPRHTSPTHSARRPRTPARSRAWM